MIKKDIFYENESWKYIKKEVDLKTLKITSKVVGDFKTEEEAKIKYIEDFTAYQKTIISIKKTTGIGYTFYEFIDYWYNEILKEYASNSYIVLCSWTINKIIKPYIEKDILLNNITQTYLEDIIEKCSSYCSTAKLMVVKLFYIIFNDAISYGLIQENPMGEIKRINNPIKKIPILTNEQITSLIQEARKYKSIYLEFLLAIFCGLRSGEILGLKFSDFDEKKQTVTISRQIIRCNTKYTPQKSNKDNLRDNLMLKPPKSQASYRTLKISPIIFKELNNRKEVIEEYKKNNKDFCTDYLEYISIGESGQLKSPSTFRAALSRICSRINIPKINPHGLRHIFATILIEQSIPLEQLSKILGHKHTSTTFEIYCGILNGNNDIREFVSNNMDPNSNISLKPRNEDIHYAI